jgi:hypothetical protein
MVGPAFSMRSRKAALIRGKFDFSHPRFFFSTRAAEPFPLLQQIHRHCQNHALLSEYDPYKYSGVGRTMKKIFLSLCLLPFAGFVQARSANTCRPVPILQPGQGCTVFYAASGGLALAGNNEDSYNPFTRVWFIPAAEGRHGRVYFGYDDGLPQGGMNDQGLFFDGLSIPPEASVVSAQKPDFPNGTLGMIDEAISVYSTVDEVVAFYERYSRPGMEAGELFFGDRTGNSAVIEGDAVIRKRGSYQVATNFRLSEFPAPPYPCSRANLVDERLKQAAGGYSVELFRQLLDDVHQEKNAQTLYSQVYDLTNGVIYFYNFHDFRHVVVWNLADELAKGPRMMTTASLFPENQEYEKYSLPQLEQWRLLYEYKIDAEVKPAALGLAGNYRTQGDAPAPQIAIYLEKGQLYWQVPHELPLELYPDSADTVFHHYYNNTELKLTLQRNRIGQVNGAQAKWVDYDDRILTAYTLDKIGVLSDSQLPGLALLIVLAVLMMTLLILILLRRRAGRKI